MKKVYCFHCQKEITPYRFFKWKICPFCYHHTNDKGEGFYLICDNCGANMPTNEAICYKCGYCNNPNLSLKEAKKLYIFNNTLLTFLFIILSVLFVIGIFYISFYLILILCIILSFYYIFNLFIRK